MKDTIETSHGPLVGRPATENGSLPERVARLADQSRAIDMAIRVLADRGIGIDEAAFTSLVRERDVCREHRDHLKELSEQAKFGSATGEHGELLADWLIRRGWVPPRFVVLYTDETSEGASA